MINNQIYYEKNNNNIKILFLIEFCILSLFSIYWLCLIRRCNSFYGFLILNFLLLLLIDFIYIL